MVVGGWYPGSGASPWLGGGGGGCSPFRCRLPRSAFSFCASYSSIGKKTPNHKTNQNPTTQAQIPTRLALLGSRRTGSLLREQLLGAAAAAFGFTVGRSRRWRRASGCSPKFGTGV